MDMVEVEVTLEGWPMQKEVEALSDQLKSLDKDARVTFRNNVKKHQPELWSAVEMHFKMKEALLLVRMEARRKRMRQNAIEHAKLHEVLDVAMNRITNRTIGKLMELLEQGKNEKK